MAIPSDIGRRVRERLRGEDGDVTTTVLLFPLVLLLVTVVIQFALAYHAKSVATAAAQDAARIAQAETGTEEGGSATATRLLSAYAGGLLDNVTVDVSRTTNRVTARVSGEVASIVPGMNFRVSGTSSGPVERFRREDER